MGRTLTIGLYAEREKLPNLTASLYKRLLARGNFQSAELRGKYPGDPAKAIFEYFSEEQLHSLARDILLPDSAEELLVEIGYQLLSGRWLPLDIQLYGPQHREGVMVLVEGYLSLNFEESESSRSVEEFLPDLGLPVVPYEEWEQLGDEVHGILWKRRAEEVYKSTLELFYRACSLPQNGPKDAAGNASYSQCSDFEHAVMHSDNGYGSLVSCSAIFHCQPSEYARDLRRIYLEYNHGIHMPITLVSDADFRDLQPPKEDPRWGIGIPGKVNSGYYPYHEYATPGTDDIIQFLDGLSKDKVEQLAALSNETVRELLAEMSANNAVPGVKVHDFGECGVALFTQPLSSVWRAYKYLAERCLRRETT